MLENYGETIKFNFRLIRFKSSKKKICKWTRVMRGLEGHGWKITGRQIKVSCSTHSIQIVEEKNLQMDASYERFRGARLENYGETN